MSPDRLINLSHIFDMVVKGLIAVVVSICGWQFKQVMGDLETLKAQNTSKETRIAVIEYSLPTLVKQIDRIEVKLDKALDRR